MLPGPEFPPAYTPLHVLRTRRRWGQTGQITGTAFTLADGHNQFLVATTATSSTCYVDTWRIRRMWVWCNNDDEKATSVSINPVGIDTSDNMFNTREFLYACQSRSQAEPGHMCIKASVDSPLGSWHKTSTVNFAGSLFILSINNNGGTNYKTVTMDIEFEYILNLVGLPQGYSIAGAGLTAGTIGGANIMGAAMSLRDINILA